MTRDRASRRKAKVDHAGLMRRVLNQHRLHLHTLCVLGLMHRKVRKYTR
jgi:hypothetical protein